MEKVESILFQIDHGRSCEQRSFLRIVAGDKQWGLSPQEVVSELQGRYVRVLTGGHSDAVVHEARSLLQASGLRFEMLED